MRNVKRVLMMACLALVAGNAVAAAPQVASASQEVVGQGRLVRMARPVKDQYIVVFKEKPGAGLPDVAADASVMARKYGVEVLHTYNAVLRGFLVRGNEHQALMLAGHPHVAYVQENGYSQAAGHPYVKPVQKTGFQAATTQTLPPWGLDRIDQDSPELDGLYRSQAGTGIDVYVLDSGIDFSHEDFAGRPYLNDYNYYNQEDHADFVGRGTHVASIIGGKTYGVAKNVTLHSVRVIDSTNRFETASVVGGLDWMARNVTTRAIANLSVSSLQVDPTLDLAAENFTRNPNFALVVSTHSNNSDSCGSSPGRISRVITVGATDNLDVRWPGSNWGACLDLFAPGVDIPGAYLDTMTGETTATGTVYAAPHVAGVAAILLANDPRLSPADLEAKLVRDSLQGVVIDPVPGSPNRLLRLRPNATALVNGVAIGAADAAGSIKNYMLTVPEGRSSLSFSISGGTGDVDLYVRHNDVPGTYVYKCRPLRTGNTETCTVSYPMGGVWFAQLRGHLTYTTTLKGTYSAQ